MNARDFPAPARGVDLGFVARQRARGTPEAAIARMGGWCVADVQAVTGDPTVRAFDRLPPRPPLTIRLDPMAIPEVAEILRHISDQYLVSISAILGDSHLQEYVEPRHEAFAVVWELNRFTLAEMASMFNKTPPGITYGLYRHYERLRERGSARDW